jgi:hypothetical protein
MWSPAIVRAYEYDAGVTGIPQLREAGWFVTGSDRHPVRHLFVRMEEHMDGTGVCM